MTKADINMERSKHYPGEIVTVPKDNTMVQAKIIGVYRNFATVTDNKSLWSVKWVDFLMSQERV